ncbi:MAG: hypothetical protein N2508_08565 [Anaerolineae bacterium]|nr:hypothetical protein [Anaerolineae bacterium]
MRYLCVAFTAVLVLGGLAGCGGQQATSGGEAASSTYTSKVLRTDYEGALDAGTQLALGTLRLEETEDAVTPEQARALLPLWQALRGGITAQAEINAVLAQIERTMTGEQLQAIAGMRLTRDDLQAWVEEHGVRPGGIFTGTLEPPGAGVVPPGWGGGTPEPGRFGGGLWMGGTPPPEMATRRAQFENMSEEERRALRATIEAGGRPAWQGGTPWPGMRRGGGQLMILLHPLIELLEERAGEG